MTDEEVTAIKAEFIKAYEKLKSIRPKYSLNVYQEELADKNGFRVADCFRTLDLNRELLVEISRKL